MSHDDRDQAGGHNISHKRSCLYCQLGAMHGVSPNRTRRNSDAKKQNRSAEGQTDIEESN